jgi:hypothetical protein
MKEFIDKISKTKCDKIIEDISISCEEIEVMYIIRSLAKSFGIGLNLKNGFAINIDDIWCKDDDTL